MINYQKIIIIGAPRSGTNMLRDILCMFDDASTWPCDEINYIWRHGNVYHNSDELPADYATDQIKKYIQRQFNWVAKKYGTQFVIEKTCANSLRVPYVDNVITNAKYIFIHRDGLDAVGSAMQRWTATLDVPYLARKVKFVPLSDLPYYASRYLWNRIYRFFSKDERLAFWGPRLNNMNKLLYNYTLDEVCALQWQACVEKAGSAFAVMPKEKWLKVSYEDFVKNPRQELGRIVSFIAINATDTLIENAISNVRSDSLGKGRIALDNETVNRLERIIYPTLKKYGYA